MATKRKKKIIDEVSKLAAEVTLQETEPLKRKLTNLEMAMKLNVVMVKNGSHLTVRSYPDGHEELEWDDEALARDVREAIASVEK